VLALEIIGENASLLKLFGYRCNPCGRLPRMQFYEQDQQQ
jgi:hypothetical protein